VGFEASRRYRELHDVLDADLRENSTNSREGLLGGA
jgi:hypothetical protein